MELEAAKAGASSAISAPPPPQKGKSVRMGGMAAAVAAAKAAEELANEGEDPPDAAPMLGTAPKESRTKSRRGLTKLPRGASVGHRHSKRGPCRKGDVPLYSMLPLPALSWSLWFALWWTGQDVDAQPGGLASADGRAE